MTALLSVMTHLGVIPVVVLQEASTARPLATALTRADLPVAEITLRTPAALAAIEAAGDVEGFIAGAGTVLTARQAKDAVSAGARFLVSPGLSREVLSVGRAADVPVLPGVVTATEVLTARSLGVTTVKFFPASTSGGPAAIRALTAPFPDIRFMPTGGITPHTMADYLAIEAVFAVGGSWIAPPDLVAAGDWDAIITRARDAVTAAPHSRSDTHARTAS